MSKGGSFLKVIETQLVIFIFLFVLSVIYHEFWWFERGWEIISFEAILIYHGFPFSFLTTVAYWGFEPHFRPPAVSFFPMNLVIDLIFWFLLSWLIVFVLWIGKIIQSINKETVKQFLKPDRVKCVVFALIFAFGIVYHEVWHFIWDRSYLWENLTYYGLPLSFYTTIRVSDMIMPYLPLSRGLVNLFIDLTLWYLVSCLVILVYRKILKPLYASKPRNNNLQVSTGKIS